MCLIELASVTKPQVTFNPVIVLFDGARSMPWIWTARSFYRVTLEHTKTDCTDEKIVLKQTDKNSFMITHEKLSSLYSVIGESQKKMILSTRLTF